MLNAAGAKARGQSQANATTAKAALEPLSGTVTDPSGALIPGATVRVKASGGATGADGQARELASDSSGHFTVSLPQGVYTVEVSAPGFSPLTRSITLGPKAMTVSLKMAIAATEQELTVGSDTGASTSAADNKSALVFKGEQLEQLSSDDNTMQQEVLAMAGGSGAGGGSIYVDGFSGGRFPPKDTIREIRINQNPFSAQYEDLGYGRVEIFTKPGSSQYHGSFFSSGTTGAFNSLNPYTGSQPPYYILFDRGDFSGPLGKKSSFFVSEQGFDQNANVVVNAYNPDGTRLTQAVPAPQNEYTVSGRLDRQVTKNNTLVARYEYSQATATNSGVGLLVLPSEGASTSTNSQTVQLSDTETFGANVVSETRFQYLRTRTGQTPNSTAPTIVVQGAFNGGGSPAQALNDATDKYEFQEYLSVSRGQHFLRLGARYRLLHEANKSTAGYNGQFIFSSLAAYQAGQPSQFSLTAGQASATLLNGDLGAYAEDEWKVRKNVTMDMGLRLESQSALPDHVNPAPRAALNWAVGQTDKHGPVVTIRANAGVFYDRFAAANLLTSIRQNGVRQQQYLVENPTFYPAIPNPGQLTGTPPIPYELSPRLRVASENIASVSVERSLWKVGSVTATYMAERNVHQYNSENVNAPRADGTRPLGGTGNVYQFASDGVLKAQTFSMNANLNGKRGQFFMDYSARRANGDTFGAGSFPSQPYNVSADYGPTGYGFQPVGQRLFAGGQVKLPYGFNLNGFVGAFSRTRFNITTGMDNNGDTIYNDRPAFATAPGASSLIYRTAYGVFDANPQPGEKIIPYNYGLGPRTVLVAAEVSRDFKFGPRPAPAKDAPAPVLKPGQKAPVPDPRYTLTFSLDTVNTPNVVNAAAPIGVLTSPFFGQSISTSNIFGLPTAANRVVFLHSGFRF